jgi:DNA-binding IclR family transcriptional regulator
MVSAGAGSAATSERGSQAINRALRILGAFSSEQPSLALKEICDLTSLTMPTAHRMARALQANGYLIQDSVTGRYSLGPAVVRLAHIVMQGTEANSLARVALPHMERLRTLTGETVGLHIPTPGGRLCIAEVQSRHMMRMATGVGNILPWHAGAASRVMLAFMPAPVVSQLLATTEPTRLTGATVTDFDVLVRHLARVRHDGFAVSKGETTEGAGAIAVAVRDAGDQVAAAINITGPLIRFGRSQMMASLPELTAAVRAIELHLGRPAR